MPTLNERLAELKGMSTEELRIEWRRVYKSAPPRISANMLRLGISYRIQEKEIGGLSATTQNKLRRVYKKNSAAGERRSIRPGTRLVRKWRDRTIVVLTLDDGFLFENEKYNSLSQIAKKITGGHWSGPRFFGLKSAHG